MNFFSAPLTPCRQINYVKSQVSHNLKCKHFTFPSRCDFHSFRRAFSEKLVFFRSHISRRRKRQRLDDIANEKRWWWWINKFFYPFYLQIFCSGALLYALVAQFDEHPFLTWRKIFAIWTTKKKSFSTSTTVKVGGQRKNLTMASQNSTREFVENWNLTQTLGEGAYGE